MNFVETLKYLDGLGETKMRLDLGPTRNFLEVLGYPDKQVKSVIVAGTNGKGSTCEFLSSILTTAGWKVGMYLSPHVESVRERVQIQGRPLEEDAFSAVATKLLQVFQEHQLQAPTYFEFLTMLALLAFADEKVDIAIFEVGLGGRLDSTNALSRVGNIITSIHFDHTHILGKELSLIAKEKGAIMRPSIPTVVASQTPEVLQIFRTQAHTLDCPLYLEGEDFSHSNSHTSFEFEGWGMKTEPTSLGLCGPHQAENASLASAMAGILSQGTKAISASQVQEGLHSASLPGRLEKWTTRDHREIWCDIGHNLEAAQSISSFFLSEGLAPVDIVIGMLQDKDYGKVIEALAPITRSLTFTSPPSPRAWNAKEVCQESALSCPSQTIESPREALFHSANQSDRLLCVGSVYTVGALRPMIREMGYHLE